MKPSKHCYDNILHIEDWKYFDNCPVCRALKKAAEEGGEISSAELEAAFNLAEKQAAD